MDEATQSTEASTLVPLIRGADCILLVGDEQQLPPTILSKEALKMELDVTLFQRLKTRGARYLLIDYITSFVIDLLLSAL